MTFGTQKQARVSQKTEWITPKFITDAVGPFDLDPCAPIHPPWPIAPKTYTIEDDGLAHPWEGRVFCNPPYGTVITERFLLACCNHRNAIALIFARTETRAFFTYVWGAAYALLFLRGRICFHHVDGTPAASSSGAPSVLVAYSPETADKLLEATHYIVGKHIRLKT